MNYARKNVQNLNPYTCARDLFKTGTLLDANENFEQWVKIDWLKVNDLNRYYDSTSEELRKKLVDKYITGFNIDNIFVGCGSDNVIDLLIRTFVEDDEFIMVMDPSYPLYKVQAEVNGVNTKSVLLNPNFTLNIDDIRNNIDKVKLLFLCSPNNPTGSLITKSEVEEIRKFYKGLIVMDEAYIEFTDTKNSFINLVKTDHNFIVLRTFSKAWGLAGIRVGYAITHPEIIDEVLKVKDSYNTTAVSQKIAMQALDQIDSLKEHVKELMLLKSSLELEFEKMGLSVIKNDTNFILLKIQNASEISKKLADIGIIVRDKSMETYMDNIIRITVGSKEENELLLLNIQKLIS